MNVRAQSAIASRHWTMAVWLASAMILAAQIVPGRHTFTMGGAAASKGTYKIIDTAGLPCTGEQTSSTYGVEHGFWPGTVNPPQAAQDLVLRATNRNVKERFSTLLANDSDADGDSLAVTRFAAESTFGARLLVDNGWVIYEAGAGFNQEDSFTYNITDEDGEVTTGTVVVSLRAESPQHFRTLVRLRQLENGTRQMWFIGIAGRTYAVQTAETLTFPVWRDLGFCTAGPNGLFEFLDSELPAAPQRYYRVMAP